MAINQQRASPGIERQDHFGAASSPVSRGWGPKIATLGASENALTGSGRTS
jgi:hypothetical protein